MVGLWLILATAVFAQQEPGLQVPGYSCADCHGPLGWQRLELARFDHRETSFPLQGSHQIQPCKTCHKGTTVKEKHQFQIEKTECNSCHLDLHNTTLGNDCRQCHGFDSWQVTSRTFNHETTRFPLLGAHRRVACEDCHRERPMIRFDVVPTDCWGCHRKTYEETTDPSHVVVQLGPDCETCHPIQKAVWQPATFDHDLQTLYPLTGAHREADCAGCHQDWGRKAPDDCWSCHQTDWEETKNQVDAPDHTASAQFVEECEICHTTETWEDAEIDHDLTEFALTGSHQTVDCNQCHANDIYDLPTACTECHQPGGLAQTNWTSSNFDHPSHNIARDCEACHNTISWADLLFDHDKVAATPCADCHLIEHTEALSPPHTNDNIGTECALCHETTAWSIANFSHTLLQTGFGLEGLHVPVACAACHVNDQYNNTPNRCENSACHLDDFNSTTDPNHNDYGYPADQCILCHTAFGWSPQYYDHSLTLDCVSCHLPDYNATTDPPHSEASGFSLVCDRCHLSTETWEGAVFDHTGITTGCVDCHLDDYNATTNPPHEASGFGTVCETCHNSTSNWQDATFDHSFPIAPNGHQDEQAETCESCHADPYQAPTFTCTLSPCHQGIDSEHFEDGSWVSCTVGGTTYTYNANAPDDPQCVNCHPNGSEDDCGGDLNSRQDWRRHLRPKPDWRED